MILSVQAYDNAEEQAKKTAPNRIIEASAPDVFMKTGYPVRVSSEKDLWRYVDAMHELRQEADYETLLQGLTADEFQTVEKITQVVADLTRREFGRCILPKGPLLRAIYTYRTLSAFLEDDNPSTIMEVGPGCGYLGALLALDGHTYIANDVTQAFYLFQNLLWHELFGDRLIEAADPDCEWTAESTLPAGAILHLPWWEFCRTDGESLNFDLDVLTCNHALCEMHFYAQAYLVKQATRWIGKNDKRRIFYAEGMGSELERSREHMYGIFRRNDFLHAYRDETIDVFVLDALARFLEKQPDAPSDPDDSDHNQEMSEETARRLYRKALFSPSSLAAGAKRATSVLFSEGVSGVTRRVRRHVSGDVALDNSASIDIPFYSVPNQIGDLISQTRISVEDENRIPWEDFVAMQQSIAGSENILSEDEEFFVFSFGKDYYS